jgi:amino acid transporter
VSATSQEPALDSEGLERRMGLFALMWASEGSIIGSGWLFGALGAVAVAGPAALFGWAIASVVILLLALVHAELGGMFPVSGGTSRYPHYAFGSFAGIFFGWFSYIQAAAVAPIEVTAALQYASSWNWLQRHTLYDAHKHVLSGKGIAVAVVLLAVFTLLNLVGVRWLARVNSTATWWKVILPVLTIIVFFGGHFHTGNFHALGGFFYTGGGGASDAIKNILNTMPTGVIFALLGFEQAVQLGGESSNPKRDLPRAVIGSILIGAVIYFLVQVVFIGGLDPKLLHAVSVSPKRAGVTNSWPDLGSGPQVFLGPLQAAPFKALAKLAGLGWLAWLLTLDAVISPSGTGLIYLTSTSRLSFGLSRNGYLPKAFEKTNRRQVPWFGILVTFLLGVLFLLPFPSWASLVGVITGASVFMYAGAPLALGALRNSKPDLPRAFRLPAAAILTPLAFVFANEVIYLSGWQTMSTLILVMIIGVLLVGASYVFKLNPNAPPIDWAGALWLVPYFVGMCVISYLGSIGAAGTAAGAGSVDFVGGHFGFKGFLPGGHGPLHFGWDILVVAIFSLVIYFVAQSRRLPTAKVDAYIRDVYPPPVGE